MQFDSHYFEPQGLKADPSILQVDQRQKLNDFFLRQREYSSNLVNSLFEELYQFFESHKLYVMYEDLLACNPMTDHLQPKNVLPIFYEKLQQVRQYLCTKVSLNFMLQLEQLVANLVGEKNANLRQAEDDMFQQETVTEAQKKMVEQLNQSITSSLNQVTYLKSQHMIENVQLFEQINQLTKSIQIYDPDFDSQSQRDQVMKNIPASNNKFEIYQLEKKLEELTAKNKALAKSNESLQLKAQEWQLQNYTQNEQLIALKAELEALTQQVKEKDEKILLIESQSKQQVQYEQDPILLKELDRFKHQIADEQRQIANLSKQLQKQATSLQSAQAEKETMSQQYQAQVDELTKQQKLLESKEINQLKIENQLMKKQLNSFQKQFKEEFKININTSTRQKVSYSKEEQVFLSNARSEVQYFGLSDKEILERGQRNGILTKQQQEQRLNDGQQIAQQLRKNDKSMSRLSDNQIIEWLKRNGLYNQYRQQLEQEKLQQMQECLNTSRNLTAQGEKQDTNSNQADEHLIQQLDCKVVNSNSCEFGGQQQPAVLKMPVPISQSSQQNTPRLVSVPARSQQNVLKQNLSIKDFTVNPDEIAKALKYQIGNDIHTTIEAVTQLNTIANKANQLLDTKQTKDRAIQVSVHEAPQLQRQLTNKSILYDCKLRNSSTSEYSTVSQSEASIAISQLLCTQQEQDKIVQQINQSHELIVDDLVEVDDSSVQAITQKRNNVKSIFEKLFIDAELWKEKLTLIRQKYSIQHSKAIEKSQQQDEITALISYVNQQLQTVQMAIQLEEQRESDISQQKMLQILQKPRGRPLCSSFQYSDVTQKYAQKPTVFRISKALNCQNNEHPDVRYYAQEVQFDPKNTKLLERK